MTYQLRLWEEGQWGIKSKLIQNKNEKSWCSGMSKASNVPWTLNLNLNLKY